MSLPFRVRPRARAVVRLRGDLHHGKADRVRKKLARALARDPDEVAVDLRKVTFLAPECGAVFLAAASEARRSGVRFVVTAGSPRSLRVLRKLGLELLLDTPLPVDQ